MSKEYKKFIKKILITAASIGISGVVIFSYIIPSYYISIFPWMLLFFTTITLLIHGYQIQLSKKNMKLFIRSSMIFSLVRLLVYSLFAIIFFITNPEEAAVFVIILAIIYISYTIIEVSDLSKISRKKE